MDHDDYPLSDWRYEVNNGDTILGYEDWVSVQRRFEVAFTQQGWKA